MYNNVNHGNSVKEAKKIIKVAEDHGVTLRLIGGLAIRFHCHGPHSKHLRAYHDIDTFGLKKEYNEIFTVFKKLDYSLNIRYNTLYGGDRLQFIHQEEDGMWMYFSTYLKWIIH